MHRSCGICGIMQLLMCWRFFEQFWRGVAMP
jgi:hypothetical protein